MEKFLFTDGMNGVKEVQSPAALESLIESSGQPDKIRIWLFSTNEWISLAAFRKMVPAPPKKEKSLSSGSTATLVQAGEEVQTIPIQYFQQKRKTGWIKKMIYVAAAGVCAFLIFNFTRIRWEEAAPLNTTAARPANVPVMDIDSLIQTIETTRGQSLDRSTKNNLRLRNTWPELVSLQLVADREKSSAGSRFFNVDVSIDNSTGVNIDNAIVKLSVWKDRKVIMSDTLRFNNIKYDKIARRELDYRYKGDSVSVAFESVRAKGFNFCYSAATKNNPGDYNDRWFCRE